MTGSGRLRFVVGLLLLAALVGWVYGPFVSNPLVFDDHTIFSNLSVYDSAQVPFSYEPRTFPNFTIGLVHVLSRGNLSWNRYVSQTLHILVVLALFFFLSRATSGSQCFDASTGRWPVVGVSLWVALNPVAVYATGYLMQRTILLATLFAILSANLYLRAQQQKRNADLFSAALLAGLSVMCKEHAVLLPLAAIALTPLVVGRNTSTLGRAAGYLVLSLPCAIWAVLHRAGDSVGASYEIYSGHVVSQIVRDGSFSFPGGIWLMSIATQLLLFWKYLFLWLVPNPQWLSADLRIDFEVLWSGWLGFSALLLTLAVAVAAVVCWFWFGARTRAGKLSAVFLFAAILFLVELSVVRVQEPFVLYRSYLWMPAYALLLCLVLCWLDAWFGRKGLWPRRVYWGVVLLVCVSFIPLAQNRLQSFSSEEALWQDALLKLPRPDVPGADRIYYNLAGQAQKHRRFDEALRFSEMVIASDPEAFHGYLSKGNSLLALGQLDAASKAFDEAAAREPRPDYLGYIEFKRCAVLEARHEHDEMIACLKRSAKMGYHNAQIYLQMSGITE